MNITIPFKTPTINHLYGFRGYRKFLTKEAKDLKKEIKEIVDKIPSEDFEDEKLSVTIFIYEDWYTQYDEVKCKDLSNREKFLTDSIFEALGLDDKYIFEHVMKKVQSEEEKAEINIEVM